jgi:hypothetical protein
LPLSSLHTVSDLTPVIAAIPTFVSGPLAGHIADLYGAEWVIAPGLLLTIPFFPLMIPQTSMAFFIVMFTMQNALMATGIGPIGVEFAAAAKSMAHKGASEIHEFSAMNFVFGKCFDVRCCWRFPLKSSFSCIFVDRCIAWRGNIRQSEPRMGCYLLVSINTSIIAL